MELRPLNLSGIFDRAATIYARAFAPFFGLVVVTIVPVAIVQYLVTRSEQPQLDATIRMLERPDALAAQHVPLLESPGALATLAASIVFAYLMLALAICAVAVGVKRLYRHETVDFAACYRVALPRMPLISGCLCLLFLALLPCCAATFALGALPIAGAALFGSTAVLFVTPLALMLMVVAFALIFEMLIVIGACAFCGIAVERQSAAQALRASLARICNRREFGRALLCASLVSLGVMAMFACVDVLAFTGLARWPAAYTLLDACARSIVQPLAAIVFAVYYFDLRVRREGYDIEAGIERIGAGSATDGGYAPTAYLSGDERALVARFLERRGGYVAPQRAVIAARLATPVRERVPDDLQSLDDESLLERL